MFPWTFLPSIHIYLPILKPTTLSCNYYKGQTEKNIAHDDGAEIVLKSYLAAIEKVNNALERFEDTQQGKYITTTTTPCDLQYSAPTDMGETLIEAFCTIGEEGNENTSAEGDYTKRQTANPPFFRFYDLEALVR